MATICPGWTLAPNRTIKSAKRSRGGANELARSSSKPSIMSRGDRQGADVALTVLGLRRRREARRRRQLSEVEEFLEELRATVGASQSTLMGSLEGYRRKLRTPRPAIAPAAATPIAPPACRAVLLIPEASPARSPGTAPLAAAPTAGVRPPMPMPQSRIAGKSVP